MPNVDFDQVLREINEMRENAIPTDIFSRIREEVLSPDFQEKMREIDLRQGQAWSELSSQVVGGEE